MQHLRIPLLWLLLGACLSYLTGWVPNLIVAAWLAPLALIRFARLAPRAWMVPVLMWPVLAVAGLATVRGAWHMGLTTEIFFSFVMALPLVASSTVDRVLGARLSPQPRTLVFPAVWVLFDYLYSFMYGLGDVFSPALTQFHVTPLIQIVSITGIYGITFLIGWFASVAATVWQDLDRPAVWKLPALSFAAVMTAVLFYGSARISGLDHDAPTVRVASIVVPHARSYWEDIIDKRTPSAEQHLFVRELAQLEDELFVQSKRAADAGAQVIFWSEGAAVMYDDAEVAHHERAAAFAREHEVYLLTAGIVMTPDSEHIDNQTAFFTPTGELAYDYLKTQTWYPTDSDGIIHSVDTPYGRIANVICFDLDVPKWMQQVADMEVDLLLVPSFDTREISPYHTEVGLYRAIEGGYSIVRGVAAGTSMAVDSTGRTLALQDAFRSADPIMYVDAPVQRTPTFYGAVGDTLPGLMALLLLGLGVVAMRGES